MQNCSVWCLSSWPMSVAYCYNKKMGSICFLPLWADRAVSKIPEKLNCLNCCYCIVFRLKRKKLILFIVFASVSKLHMPSSRGSKYWFICCICYAVIKYKWNCSSESMTNWKYQLLQLFALQIDNLITVYFSTCLTYVQFADIPWLFCPLNSVSLLMMKVTWEFCQINISLTWSFS